MNQQFVLNSQTQIFDQEIEFPAGSTVHMLVEANPAPGTNPKAYVRVGSSDGSNPPYPLTVFGQSPSVIEVDGYLYVQQHMDCARKLTLENGSIVEALDDSVNGQWFIRIA